MADASNAYTQAINNALTSAKGMLGKNEVPNHAELQSYLRDGGQDLDPHKLAWCAAFVSASLQKAGLPVPTQVVKDSAFGPGAYAPNYQTYGSAVDPKNIQAGDILVNNNGSHVGFAEGPIRQGQNGPEVQLLAGNERDASGQYAPGSYTNPTTGAVANRSQVGQVGERWVPLSQYSARRYQPPDDGSQPAAASSASSSAAPSGTTLNSVPPTVTASTPFSLSRPTSSIPSAGQFQPLIDAAAKKYNLDPNFLDRVLWQENRFRPEGTSTAGAQGFAQFMPGTAARYGVDVHNPASSIEGAAHYLSDLSGRYSGNLGLAAAGYNWGEGNVDQWLQGRGKPPPPETTNYVNTITGHSVNEWRADPRLPLGSSGPGRSPSGPSGAPTTPAGGPAATPTTPAAGTTLPGFQPGSPANKMAQDALKKLSGGDGGGDQPQAPPLEQAQSQAVGGPMMMRPGGMNVADPRIAATQALQQQGFMTQPSLAALGGGALAPPVPPAGVVSQMPGMSSGMPALPGTTLNSPSQLQMALMSGSLNPYDMYARQAGGFGST